MATVKKVSFNPDFITHGVEKSPRKMIITGPPKLGKTTLAASAKDSLLILTEDRASHIKCRKTPVCQTYEQFQSIIEWLVIEGVEKTKVRRVVIDTADSLEALMWEFLVRKNDWKSIDDDKNKETAFQRGKKFHALNLWKDLLYNLDQLRDDGMDVIIVSHTQVSKVNRPDTDEYERLVMKIEKSACALLEEWADILAYYSLDIYISKTDDNFFSKKAGKKKAISKKTRTLYLSGDHPSIISGNCYGFPDIKVKEEYCQDIMEALLTETGDDWKDDKYPVEDEVEDESEESAESAE